MRSLISTIKNIYRIEDLRNRIFRTFFYLVVYIFATNIVIPGIDINQISQTNTNRVFLTYLDLMSFNSLSRFSIVGISIVSILLSSSILNIMSLFSPYFQRLEREGEEGKKKKNQIGRYFLVLFSFILAFFYIRYIKKHTSIDIIFDNVFLKIFWYISICLLIVASNMFTLWLSEKITDKGIYRGIYILVLAGFLNGLTNSIIIEIHSLKSVIHVIYFIITLVTIFFTTLYILLFLQGVRRVPVQYAKRIVGNKQYGGGRKYISLKLSNGFDLIITLIIYIDFFLYIFNFNLSFFQYSNLLIIILLILYPLFQLLQTAVNTNSYQMLYDMEKNGGFIPGVKPGRRTVEFLDRTLSKLTTGNTFFFVIFLLNQFIAFSFTQTNLYSFYVSAIPFLIIIPNTLGVLQGVESHLLMRHYDGLLKSGRIKKQ